VDHTRFVAGEMKKKGVGVIAVSSFGPISDVVFPSPGRFSNTKRSRSNWGMVAGGAFKGKLDCFVRGKSAAVSPHSREMQRLFDLGSMPRVIFLINGFTISRRSIYGAHLDFTAVGCIAAPSTHSDI